MTTSRARQTGREQMQETLAAIQERNSTVNMTCRKIAYLASRGVNVTKLAADLFAILATDDSGFEAAVAAVNRAYGASFKEARQ